MRNIGQVTFANRQTKMNVHTYQKDLEQLLLTGERESQGKNKVVRPTYYSGVYILSRSLKNLNYKLGMAWGTGGIFKRIISQYKICFAGKDEFFIRYLVICPRQKEGKKHFAYLMEQELLASIKEKVPIDEDSRKYGAYSKEYIFVPEIKKLEETMGEVLNNEKYKPYYTHAIKFVKDGFHTFDPKYGFNTKLQDFSMLVNLNPTVHAMLALSNKDLKLDEKVEDIEKIKEPKAKAKPKASAKAPAKKTIVRLNERPERTNKKIPAKFKD